MRPLLSRLGRLLGLLALGACRPGVPDAARAEAPAPDATITLALGGDTMLARGVTEAILARGPEYVWGDARPLVRGADLALVNLECAIAESGEPFVPRRVFHFRAAPRAIDALRAAGIDYVSMANNHALDYRPPALEETVRRLDEAGIAHAGAGADLSAAARPAVIEAKGVRVAVVSFADHYREYKAGPDRAGTNVIDVRTDGDDFARVRASLDAARATGAHLVVFSIHWGPNMEDHPQPGFREFAHAVIDAGADLFHGHSAHVFQGIEVYRGRPILYDTGELVDDYVVDEDLRNDRALLFVARAGPRGVVGLDLVPLFIARRQVNLARGEEFAAISARIRELSAEMGTEIRPAGDRLEVVLPGPVAAPGRGR